MAHLPYIFSIAFVLAFVSLPCAVAAEPAAPAVSAPQSKKTKQPAKKGNAKSQTKKKSTKSSQQAPLDSKQLKKQKDDAQKQLNKSQKQLAKNKSDQKEKAKQIAKIEGEIKERVNHIHSLEGRIDTLERGVAILERRADSLNAQLDIKRQRYAQAVRYARTQRLDLTPAVFIMSGNTPAKIVRRARYAQQYANYQRQLGEGVMAKRAEAINMQHLMLSKKEELNILLGDIINERRQLATDRQRHQDILNGLVKTQKSLDRDVERQRKQIADLDRKIEERIAYEIEQERKRAEAEARRKAEAAKKKGSNGAATAKSKGSSGKASSGKSSSGKGSSGGSVWNTTEDRALSGSFQQNKGRLPVPITGSYYISRGFGIYHPDGTRGVTLDNKGIDYTGKAGARARAVFDGVVTSIVNNGGMKFVLVRHGSYISAYCNLSSVIVTEGQKLRARDLIGTVAADGKGTYTLKFQLRKERTILNPSGWIGK